MLKTLGLAQLMAQSATYPSRVQGIQKSSQTLGMSTDRAKFLSTFSSHMTNIVSIFCKVLMRESSVLLDELGAGDPQEGPVSHRYSRRFRWWGPWRTTTIQNLRAYD